MRAFAWFGFDLDLNAAECVFLCSAPRGFTPGGLNFSSHHKGNFYLISLIWVDL